MFLPLKIETLMWLLPVVFMLHDFEEIIMFKPWLRKNRGLLQTRFPRLAVRFLPAFDRQSSSSFALAVAEEFVILSVLTAVAVEFELYNLWAGILLAFFVHLLVHLAQFAVYRRYVPCVVTSLLSSFYCLAALHTMQVYQALDWPQVAGWTALMLVMLGANLVLAHNLGARFNRWLEAEFADRS